MPVAPVVPEKSNVRADVPGICNLLTIYQVLVVFDARTVLWVQQKHSIQDSGSHQLTGPWKGMYLSPSPKEKGKTKQQYKPYARTQTGADGSTLANLESPRS